MTKKDLRTRVYAVADELFVERGSLERFGYREVRERAQGASNDVMVLFDDWRESRKAMMKSRPDALVAAAEDFAGRLWLMARLLARGGATHAVAADSRPASDEPTAGPGSAAPAPERRRTPKSEPVGRNGKASRGGGSGLFSDLPRPERPPPKRRPKNEKTRKSVAKAMKARITLVPPRLARHPVTEVSEPDWKGAHDEPLAKAIAGKLRAEGTRRRAGEIWKRLPPSLKPGTFAHAERDLKKAVEGSKIQWFRGGWFWFHGEEIPKKRPWRVDSKDAKRRARGEELWWRVAHTIAQLEGPFTQNEMKAACGEHLSKLAATWLRLRLVRARDRDPSFLKWTPPDVYEWTGLPPSEVVKEE